jgi:hypothetical protein
MLVAEARNLGIQLEFIPPGATNRCHPFEANLFGSMKNRACSRIEAQMMFDGDGGYSIKESGEMLLDAWNMRSKTKSSGIWT